MSLVNGSHYCPPLDVNQEGRTIQQNQGITGPFLGSLGDGLLQPSHVSRRKLNLPLLHAFGGMLRKA